MDYDMIGRVGVEAAGNLLKNENILDEFNVKFRGIPIGSPTKEFATIVAKYKSHPKAEPGSGPALPFNPTVWLTYEKMREVCNSLRGLVELWYAAEIKKLKTEKMEPEDRKKEIKDSGKRHIDDLKKVKELVPHIIIDFRERRDRALAEMKPESSDAMKSDPLYVKNFDWVYGSGVPAKTKILEEALYSEAEQKKMDELSYEGKDIVLEKVQTTKPEPKQKGVTPVGIDKFILAGNDLHITMNNIKSLAAKLGSVQGELPSPEKIKKADEKIIHRPPGPVIEKEPSRYQPGSFEEAEALQEELHDEAGGESEWKKLKPEEQKARRETKYEEMHKLNPDEQITRWDEKRNDRTKKFLADIDKRIAEADAVLKKKLNEIKKDVEEQKVTEKLTTGYAPVLWSNTIAHEAEWFSKLHSMYHGAIWIHNKPEEKDISQMIKVPVYSPEVGVPDTKTAAGEEGVLHEKAMQLRKALLDRVDHFIGMDYKSKGARDIAKQVQEAAKAFSTVCEQYLKFFKIKKNSSSIISSIIQRFQSGKTGLETKTGDVRHFFHDPKFEEIFPLQKLYEELKTRIPDPGILHMARGELKSLHDFFEEEHLNPTPEFIAHAKKDNKTPHQFMGDILKGILSVFVDNWTKDVEKRIGEKDDKESKKLAEEYPTLSAKIRSMHSQVDRDKNSFPALAPEKRKETTEGIPSSKAIVDYIEENWMQKPKMVEEELRQYSHLHGGGGSTSKTKREKPQKLIVNISDEVLKKGLMDYLLDKKVKNEEGEEVPATPSKFFDDMIFDIGMNMKREHNRTNAISDEATVIKTVASLLEKDIPRILASIPMMYGGIKQRAQQHRKDYTGEPGTWTERLKGGLIDLDKPENRLFYEKRYNAIKGELEKLLNKKMVDFYPAHLSKALSDMRQGHPIVNPEDVPKGLPRKGEPGYVPSEAEKKIQEMPKLKQPGYTGYPQVFNPRVLEKKSGEARSSPLSLKIASKFAGRGLVPDLDSYLS